VFSLLGPTLLFLLFASPLLFVRWVLHVASLLLLLLGWLVLLVVLLPLLLLLDWLALLPDPVRTPGPVQPKKFGRWRKN
jgi:hypothetical protein